MSALRSMRNETVGRAAHTRRRVRPPAGGPAAVRISGCRPTDRLRFALRRSPTHRSQVVREGNRGIAWVLFSHLALDGPVRRASSASGRAAGAILPLVSGDLGRSRSALQRRTHVRFCASVSGRLRGAHQGAPLRSLKSRTGLTLCTKHTRIEQPRFEQPTRQAKRRTNRANSGVST